MYVNSKLIPLVFHYTFVGLVLGKGVSVFVRHLNSSVRVCLSACVCHTMPSCACMRGTRQTAKPRRGEAVTRMQEEGKEG